MEGVGEESGWAFTLHPGNFQIGVERRKSYFLPPSEVWGYGLRIYIILWGGVIKFNPVREPKMGDTENSTLDECMDPFLFALVVAPWVKVSTICLSYIKLDVLFLQSNEFDAIR